MQGIPWSLRLGWPDCLQWDPSWCCQPQERSGGGSCRRCLVRAAHSCASDGLEVRSVTGALRARPAHVVGSPALMMSSKETGCFFPSAMVMWEGLCERERSIQCQIRNSKCEKEVATGWYGMVVVVRQCLCVASERCTFGSSSCSVARSPELSQQQQLSLTLHVAAPLT